MLTVLALQNNWVTKQIDFSNAFVQAPINYDGYVTLPPMFDDKCGIDPKSLCLKLNHSHCKKYYTHSLPLFATLCS